MVEIKRRGMMIVVSSPSGAGKSTLAKRLLESDPEVTLSVSVTTRPARPGETEGTDYFFRSREQFESMIAEGEFLEYAEVFENLYGTPRGPVEEVLSGGRDVLFDIDWQGARQLEQTVGNDLVRIFILPPSVSELERRLNKRAQDAPEIVAKRMAKAADEMSHWPEYDYVIVNEDVESSHRRITAIVQAERLRRSRQVGLNSFVKTLLDEI